MAEPPRRTLTQREQQEAMGRAIAYIRDNIRPAPHKMTQEEAATRMGVERQAWNNYEKGKRANVLHQSMQDQIARALGVTREELLLEYQHQTGEAPPAPRAERRPDAWEDRAARYGAVAEGGKTRAEIPLGRGRAVLTYPDDLDDVGRRHLADWLQLLARQIAPMNA